MSDTPKNSDLAMDLLSDRVDRLRAELAETRTAGDALAAEVQEMLTGPVPDPGDWWPRIAPKVDGWRAVRRGASQPSRTEAAPTVEALPPTEPFTDGFAPGAFMEVTHGTGALPAWRVGRKVGRTVYIGDELIGVMDSPELATQVVGAVNAALDHVEATKQRDITAAAEEVVWYWVDWPQSRRDRVRALSTFLHDALVQLAAQAKETR